jgi:hypothetical protein
MPFSQNASANAWECGYEVTEVWGFPVAPSLSISLGLIGQILEVASFLAR